MKKIEGAPETITHAQVLAACDALGLDPKWTRAIRISADGQQLEVVLHAAQPARLLSPERDRPAEHTIWYDLLVEPSPADD